MNNENLQIHVLRAVAIIGFVIIIFCIIKNFREIQNSPIGTMQRIGFYLGFFINLVTLIGFAFLILKPYKLEYFSLICFFYAFIDFIEQRNAHSPMNGLMFLLGIVMLYTRGFFVKRRKIKSIIFGLGYIVLLLLSLFRSRHNMDLFLEEIACSFVAVVMLAVVVNWYSRMESVKLKALKSWDESNELVLNLFDFNLDEREREWVKKMLSGQKQAAVAMESGLSAGYFRNKVRNLYQKLDVRDYVDLLVKYGNLKVISTNEELVEWQKKRT